MLLPLAFLLHVAEEWFGGFPEWTALVIGDGLEPGRFLVINAVGLLLFTAGTVAAFRNPSMAWIVASLAALVGLNAALHALATIAFSRYSPGTVTGLLLYLPLSIVVLRSSATLLPRPHLVSAVVFGVLLHALVTLVALA
jgi:hypothetical protein